MNIFRLFSPKGKLKSTKYLFKDQTPSINLYIHRNTSLRLFRKFFISTINITNFTVLLLRFSKREDYNKKNNKSYCELSTDPKDDDENLSVLESHFSLKSPVIKVGRYFQKNSLNTGKFYETTVSSSVLFYLVSVQLGILQFENCRLDTTIYGTKDDRITFTHNLRVKVMFMTDHRLNVPFLGRLERDVCKVLRLRFTTDLVKLR